jgi:hypothetical protein
MRPVRPELLNAEGRKDRQTDMTMLIVAFRTFAKVPKNSYHSVKCNIITWSRTKYTYWSQWANEMCYVMYRLEVINLPAL